MKARLEKQEYPEGMVSCGMPAPTHIMFDINFWAEGRPMNISDVLPFSQKDFREEAMHSFGVILDMVLEKRDRDEG